MTIETKCVAFIDKNNAEYSRSPIGSDDDLNKSAVMEWYLQAPHGDRSGLAVALSGQCSRTLLCYAERMATYAVRTGSDRSLRLGMLAIGLASCDQLDDRDAYLVLAVLHDACDRIGKNEAEIIQAVMPYVSDKGRGVLSSWFIRDDNSKSIESMGYTTSIGSDGFGYVRSW